MNVCETEQIRNIVLLGHGGADKTTAAEALAPITDMTTRIRKVPDGSTTSDYDKEKIKRQFSVSTMLIPLEYVGEDRPIKIDPLDTPGFFDFVGEIGEAISVVDTATIIVNYKAGIESGTEKAWETCEKYNLPRLIFVTNMDDDHASYRELVVKMETCFGRKIAPLQLSIRKNEKSVNLANVIKMAGRRFTRLSDYEEYEIPDYAQKDLTVAGDALIEAVVETNEEYTERYFLGEEFTQEEISTALREHVIEGDIVPIMMGSGINYQGLKVLLQATGRYFPSPDHFECIGVDVFTGERSTVKYNDDVSLSARIFKTTVDPFIGKYLLMKVYTGTLKGDIVVYNVNKDTEEKIRKLYILRGKEQTEVQGLGTDDISAVTKLTVTRTGDTTAVCTASIVYRKPQTSTSYTYMAYKVASKDEDGKISIVLTHMTEEDLALKVVNDAENHQSPLYDIGDQQLDVVVSKLQSRYRVGITPFRFKFTFRGTLRKKIKVQDKHKKQSGGHGQYGDVIMEFEPSGDFETPFVLEEKVFGGPVPGNYFPAVEKGLQGCVVKGPLAGYPMIGLKTALLNGSHHPVDSSGMAFKMATVLIFKQGFMDANPVFLEPTVSLKVTVPDKFASDVMGDLNRRRGHILGMNSGHNGKQMIEVDIPMLGLLDYSTDLRSTTGSIGLYSYEFTRYEQALDDVQKRKVEARAAVKDSE